MFLKRTLSTFVLMAAGAIVLTLPAWLWSVFILVVSMRLNSELAVIMSAKGYRHAQRMSTLFSALIVVTTACLLYFRLEDPYISWPVQPQALATPAVSAALATWRAVHPLVMTTQSAALALAFVGIFCIFCLFDKPRATIADIATSFLGLIYVGWFPTFWILIRWIPGGMWLMIWVTIGIVMSDISAYLVGRVAGKHPFFPQLSPKKTIEGATGSMIITSATLAAIGPYFGIPMPHALTLGLLMAVAAQAGDLAESLLKRDAGVKDSANLIPGHGGLLDRFDSFLFTAPLAYFYLAAFVFG
ncbi:MAG: phosphatidate cytidylyltransferase [Candidatus Sericytochromatia bacterium]|nr:phosphatidate cytidylyltransferase [Candidatus Sericytochromatia bacterium]